MSEKDEKKFKVTWQGWVSLFILILMFSGIFGNVDGPLKALDLNNLIGSFGVIGGDGVNFMGANGSGARDGFLFGLSIIPTTALSVGLIDVVDHLGGLKAAEKLFTPILRPLLGIPGIAGLAFVSSFTSSDVGAVMTKQLVEDGSMTDDERTIFVAYQYQASAVVLNVISTQAPLLPIVVFPIGAIILFLWVCKVVGANIVRIYINSKKRKEVA
ncbi:hypothetical protein SAMN02745245_01483 [Anaerosphaera aminiphila DSM 21120]|uniref:Nucleoside transporter/FeoB GTPase Gate domain-containing protein n=1 Tax=Anaerosphaera aminiphila DSM 21120 TaxID=1120995 RepID=A0A1M5TIF4_9FIRM|nr:nucleoside recognition domain-containing protein [Anaerosphaera aminiphila]SHH50532.1 hypothetical protein SAMN02745245_01483 [Anaerosphaera aminiphila DSM 21120]